MTFKHWKRLDPCGLVPSWFDLSVRLFGGVASPSGCFSHKGGCGSFDIHQSLGFGVICNDLLNIGAAHLSVYTDGSLSNLGTVDMLAGAVVFFKDINSGLSMRVSAAAIDAYRSESLLVGPNFRNCCWIEHRHITNVIHRKNLDVNWIKIKGYSGVSGNEHADVLAKNAALSAWHLPHLVNKRFLKAGVDTVGSGSQIVPGCLHADIDWLRSFLVWHPDFHMVTGFTSVQTAGFCTYFMKVLHYCLPVAVQKHLYDRSYPSVVCLFCDKVEVSDHVFSCSSDTDIRASLLDTYAAA
ncbi:hypothetical protein G9A89_011712 [Geosiphon pyriformis]|nr:hypothetical protein G9A89_011712 [Geosiphon pyriformis]